MVRVERDGGIVRVKIFFHDLKEEAQKALLEAYDVFSPEDMNWDIVPIDVISEEEQIDFTYVGCAKCGGIHSRQGELSSWKGETS